MPRTSHARWLPLTLCVAACATYGNDEPVAAVDADAGLVDAGTLVFDGDADVQRADGSVEPDASSLDGAAPDATDGGVSNTAVVVRGIAAASSANSASIGLTIPAGVQADDLLVVVIDAHGSISAPSFALANGWKLELVVTAAKHNTTIWTRRAVGNEMPFPVASAGSFTGVAFLVAYGGATTVSALVTNNVNASSDAIGSPARQPSEKAGDHYLLVASAIADKPGFALSVPPGFGPFITKDALAYAAMAADTTVGSPGGGSFLTPIIRTNQIISSSSSTLVLIRD